MKTVLAVTSLVLALFMVSGCSMAPATRVDPASSAEERQLESVWESYAGTWTLDQIVAFDSELSVVGTIEEIESPTVARIDSEATLEWVPVRIQVDDSSDDNLIGQTFTARVIPAFDSQADLTLLKAGDRVLYLGNLPSEDSRGESSGTSSWIIKVGGDGTLGATSRFDTVHGKFASIAASVGLTRACAPRPNLPPFCSR